MCLYLNQPYLMVPECEIFDRSDFYDFYTLKPFWVGDIGAQIWIITLIFGGARHHLISDAHAEQYHAHQFLRIRSVHAPVSDLYAQGTYHFLMRMHSRLWRRLCSVHALVPDAYAQCTHQFLTCMLSARISSWRARVRVSSWPICAHKSRSMRVRNSIFSIILNVPKIAKI